jgi:hypothetical protein
MRTPLHLACENNNAEEEEGEESSAAVHNRDVGRWVGG